MKFLDEAKVYIRSGTAATAAWRSAARSTSSSADRAAAMAAAGDVVIEAVDGLNTLIDYRYQQHFKAQKAPTAWQGPPRRQRQADHASRCRSERRCSTRIAKR